MVISTVLFFVVGLSVVNYFNHKKEELHAFVMGNFYEKIVWVNNPENLTVLVNKNYRLSDEYEPDDLVLLTKICSGCTEANVYCRQIIWL